MITLDLPPNPTGAEAEDFEERAAILEFDAGLPRDEAERRAVMMIQQSNFGRTLT